MNTITALQQIDYQEHLPSLLSQMESCLAADEGQPKRRGRPMTIQWGHLWLGLLMSVLLGMNNYQQWWRRMCSQAIGSFAPVSVTDDALIKRLRTGGNRAAAHTTLNRLAALGSTVGRTHPMPSCSFCQTHCQH